MGFGADVKRIKTGKGIHRSFWIYVFFDLSPCDENEESLAPHANRIASGA